MEAFGRIAYLVNLLLLVYSIRVSGESSDPRVTTALGELVGRLVHFHDKTDGSSNRVEVKQFLAVPYAKPPLGNLRFRRPAPVEAWGCSLPCHTMPNACVQIMKYPFPWAMPIRDTYISEDCLYMNIWVPKDASPENKKSVLFYIHGGGFFMGSARQHFYNGRVLTGLGDVIVVVPNYRLGSFGFWSNNKTSAPGNVGIWDVIEALKWVNNHIESFGGDKGSITIAGQDAGAIIVSLLAITPHATGLYKRQIVQSGSAMWKLMDDEFDVIERSQLLSESAKCAKEPLQLVNHPNKMVKCMRGINDVKLIKKEAKETPRKRFSFLPRWGDELFPRNPRDVLLEGNFPFTELLIGVSGHEGAYILTTENSEKLGFLGEKNETFSATDAEEVLRKDFLWLSQADQDKIKEQYLDGKNLDNSNQARLAAANALGDFEITCPTVYYASASAKSGANVYFYQFFHRPTNSPWAEWMWATHFDEVYFAFGGPIQVPERYSPEEGRLSKMMVTHWTNFVKHGKPQDDWPLYTDTSEIRVYVSNEEPQSDHLPKEGECAFWRNIIYQTPPDSPEYIFEEPSS